MKRIFIVSYDITDDKRRHKVAQTLKAYGTRIQYSVWRCELAPMARIDLEAALAHIIQHREDQILFIDLRRIGGRADTCIEALGKKYLPNDRGPRIV